MGEGREKKDMAYFPMFVSLEGEPCLVIGGGKVAARKIRGLLEFGADVTVVAPAFCGDILDYKDLHKIQRPFCEKDLQRAWFLVAAASDCRQANHRAAELCRAARIPVNVADCMEECTFFFPAYCVAGNVSAGFSSAGQSPSLAGGLRGRLEKVLHEWIGEEIRAGRGGRKSGRTRKDTAKEKNDKEA